jgi:hypothetical protein
MLGTALEEMQISIEAFLGDFALHFRTVERTIGVFGSAGRIVIRQTRDLGAKCSL